MTDLPPGATIAATGVKFEKSLRFNDWRDFVEQLQRMSDRLAWALGDAWLEAGVYRIDYHDGVERLRRSAPDAARCAEVAGQVETSRRREGLSFTHHALVTSLTPNEQDNWLDDAERQGWSVKELRDALGDRKTKRVGQRPAVHLTAAEPEPPAIQRTSACASAGAVDRWPASDRMRRRAGIPAESERAG